MGNEKRERFLSVMAGERTEQFSQFEHGFWQETYERFQQEGLPGDVTYPELFSPSKNDLCSYFDILKIGYIRPTLYNIPYFDYEVLEETDEYIIARNGHGAILETFKGNQSLPREIDFTIKCREDYLKYRERFKSGMADERLAYISDELITGSANQDNSLVVTHMDGFFAYLREIMGVENTLMMFYDDPEYIHMIYDDMTDMYMEVYSRILDRVKPDFAFIWEDMCFKNGPLVSPGIFSEFMVPNYKKIVSFLHDYSIKNIIVDSDGDVLKLMPLWREAGVTGILPFEVQAGMDVTKIDEEFPDMVLVGGIDKRVFASGKKEDIDNELDRVLPAMAKRGRYIPTLDHWVPPEVSLDAFGYYVEKVRNFRL